MATYEIAFRFENENEKLEAYEIYKTFKSGYLAESINKENIIYVDKVKD